ncbi:MAG: DEAD/DEAH box helicase [Planctomycetes bacterium]|nr:DEAD/DEAH box helicase [Planctomycetota bacterium]MCP4769922.1 DEAD/DEAH box helicase [Planctomycetota bacterium]MCP4859762.1 DEAD/DEAH box helicase [Planctomycetota bacterium]
MTEETEQLPRFADLGLATALVKAAEAEGYETPSPIQSRTIPPLLEGKDVIGQAQTGTGKTAAFAMPLLSRIDIKNTTGGPQVLVLCPTRELAIQVAEAFQRYARFMKNFHVLPIYGGQAYSMQLRPLKRGVHVVVGTPGRVMDHMRRGSLKLDNLQALVLDEADEMLRMGFIDDVTWVLERTPEERQIALFSATMPDPIRRIAQDHLSDPEEILIRQRTSTATTINQRFQVVSGPRKLDALTRILEAEEFDAMLVFVRTRNSTSILAEKLEARGYAARALSGDVSQVERERAIDRLKKGQLDIIVATDVAARGLDVDRVSHVVNFDIPTDTESYVHRIGRTGRAGRTGEAILFVSPREKRMLRTIERAIGTNIEPMTLPTTEDVNRQRIARFKQRIVDAVEQNDELDFYAGIVEQCLEEHPDMDPRTVMAALARMTQGEQSLLIKDNRQLPNEQFQDKGRNRERPDRGRNKFDRGDRGDRGGKFDRKGQKRRVEQSTEAGMERFRVEVGHHHGVRPGSIVGAIANEAGLEGRFIGKIEIYDDFSTVDLPEGMPKDIFRDLQQARVCNQKLNIRPVKS